MRAFWKRQPRRYPALEQCKFLQAISKTTLETKTHSALSKQEIEFFRTEGYLGPFAAVSPEEMQRIRHHIDSVVLQKDGPNPRTRLQSRHMDSRVVYDLATAPAITERMAALYGPDLIMWATNFFNKEPGGAEIPWHQDFNYWPLEPMLNISAWIAIDDVKIDNSCVQLLPRSHKKMLAHVPSRPGMAFGEEADPVSYATDNLVNMELQPGEFFLFNEKLLHHSHPNRSNRRRLGMSVRMTLPIVQIAQDNPPLHPGHRAIVARGTDYMGFNRLQEPPAAG
jgi:ectoine hydroxylase-related dioxygenase (phytanoyl-CoA dioxygenase family)